MSALVFFSTILLSPLVECPLSHSLDRKYFDKNSAIVRKVKLATNSLHFFLEIAKEHTFENRMACKTGGTNGTRGTNAAKQRETGDVRYKRHERHATKAESGTKGT
jgi:hypothetical protein